MKQPVAWFTHSKNKKTNPLGLNCVINWLDLIAFDTNMPIKIIFNQMLNGIVICMIIL